MKTVLLGLGVLLLASSANATTITWQDSGNLTSVGFGLPGLSVGTPWTLQVEFDPNGPGTKAALAYPGAECNIYAVQSATFTLGGFSYNNSGGHVWTNSRLPGDACSPTPTGMIQFEFVGGWTQQPGAWNLNSGVLLAGYFDALKNDGTLPAFPSLSGFNSGLGYYDGLNYPAPAFQDSTFAPMVATAVPEPGTLTMLGAGLVYGLRRLRRRQA